MVITLVPSQSTILLLYKNNFISIRSKKLNDIKLYTKNFKIKKVLLITTPQLVTLQLVHLNNNTLITA